MPPKDRLADLHRVTQNSGRKGDNVPEVTILVRQDAIDKFLEKVENASQSIDLVETKIAAIRSIHASILSTPSVSPQEKDDLDRVMRDITNISTNIRNDLQGIQKDVEKPGIPRLEFRIRKTQHAALARRLVNVMASYNAEQADYRQKCLARMRRQLDIADVEGRPTTDEGIEALLDTPNPLIFSQGVIADSQKAKEALADIEARHQDILMLERNIREIKDLFLEVANLVDAQGVTLDRVEDNMDIAAGKLTDAKDQTAGALTKQQKTRRLKIGCLIFLVVVALIVVISLAIYLG